MTDEPISIDFSWRMPRVDPGSPDACPICHGVTTIIRRRMTMAGGIATTVVDRVPCPTCHGLGLTSEPPPDLAGE